MSYLKIYLFTLLSLVCSLFPSESKFVVIICSYNNSAWVNQNLKSLSMQNYKKFRAIYVDDASTDGTCEKVEEFLKNTNPHFPFKLIKNTFNKGAMRNLYEVIHEETHDDEIIVTLDGDDFLASKNVLSILDKVYSNKKKSIWVTYGQFIWSSSKNLGFCAKYPDHIQKMGAFRNHEWLASHLRTFYSWIFKKIKKEDFQIEGTFLKTSWDQAIMLPLLEMARNHYMFIPHILYIYNDTNPISDCRIYSKDCDKTYHYIRSLPPYHPLD